MMGLPPAAAAGALTVSIPSVPLPAAAAAGGAWSSLSAAGGNPPGVPSIPPTIPGSNDVRQAIPVGPLPVPADVVAASHVAQEFRRANLRSNAFVTDQELARAELVATITQAEYAGFGPSAAGPGVAALTDAVATLSNKITELANGITELSNNMNTRFNTQNNKIIELSNNMNTRFTAQNNNITNLDNTVNNLSHQIQTNQSDSTIGQRMVADNARIISLNITAFAAHSPTMIIRPRATLVHATWGAAGLTAAQTEYPADFPAAGLTTTQYNDLTYNELSRILAHYGQPVPAGPGAMAARQQLLKSYLIGQL